MSTQRVAACPWLSTWNTPTVIAATPAWRHTCARRPAAVGRQIRSRRCAASRQLYVRRSSTVSVFRPRKSNFTRPAGSTHFMLNWVAGMVGARILVERHQFGQRPVADDDAGGVGRGVAVTGPPRRSADLQALRLTAGSSSRRLLQLRLAGRWPAARVTGIGRVVRHHLASRSTWPSGICSTRPTSRSTAARLQGAEGDDLGDPVLAVARLHIVDHLARAAPGRSRCRSRAWRPARD